MNGKSVPKGTAATWWPATLGIAVVAAALAVAPLRAANDGARLEPGGDDGESSARLQVVMGAGLFSTHAYDYVKELSDDIGGRLTGSPEASRAIDWGVKTMRSIGLQDVHTEPWTLWRGWTRETCEVSLISPVRRKLTADSMGWVGSTPSGGVDAEVLQVNLENLSTETQQHSAGWSGRILLVRRSGDRQARRVGSAEYDRFLKAAFAAHAVAVIGGQGGARSAGIKLTHTGILGFGTYYDVPVVSMASEDQSQIERLLDSNQAVRLHMNVQNVSSPAPVPSANVVGDIRGSEHPEQVFVVGAHLDSWDLAQGATDNGCGTATVLAAAEAILRSGLKPRRTLRFVLFTGEEQGLLGSREFVRAHQAEMANYLGDVVLDEGQGPILGFDLNGRSDLASAFSAFAARLTSLGKLNVISDPVFGTDTASFTLAGLPGILLTQDVSDYQVSRHSAADTLDKVDAIVLTRNATIEAVLAFWVADQPKRIAEPWPASKTEGMLKDTHMEDQLKGFGMWPFAD